MKTTEKSPVSQSPSLSIPPSLRHSATLGELETAYPCTVLNHCFEVELTGDQLIFDYQLKPGISQKLNASYLMRKMGIIG